MVSQSPQPPAEVKTEEQTAEIKDPKQPEVAEGSNANATTPASGSGSGLISKQTAEVIEGILHRLTAYKTEE